jgi:hypothetical protein
VSSLLDVSEGATPRCPDSDEKDMRIPILTAVATLAIVPAAFAQAGGGGSVEPVSDEALNRPVAVNVTFSDATGNAVGSPLSCEWSTGGPADDDRPCLRFQSDPQVAFEAIEEAGGVRADKVTTVDGEPIATSYTRRVDGTWLIRSKGNVNGSYMHFGMVCTRDGQSCTRWDADGAKFARKDVRAAAAKLKKRR